MRAKRPVPFQSKPKLAVVVDGETEFWYLKMIQRNERAINLDIKPEIPQRKELSAQYSRVIELSNIYDKVAWIIDLDVVLKESKLKEFLKYKQEIEKKFKNVFVIINQPCIEYWFLLHFEFTSPQFSNCEGAEKLLKKHLTDYSKTEKYYIRQGNDIYSKLKGNLANAIANAKKLGEFDPDSPNKGYSDMFKLFREIGIE